MAPTATRQAGAGTGEETGLNAWRALLRGHATLLRELDEELRDEHDLTIGDYDVLIHLADAPEQQRKMCDLAAAVLLSPSGLTRRVDRLERAGLVERVRSKEDARSFETRLTVEGKRFFAKVRKTHLAGIKRLFVDRFDDAELETLEELLGRLADPDLALNESC